MADLSDGAWRLVESAYVEGTEPMTVLAERFGISRAQLVWRRDKFGWPQRKCAGGGVDAHPEKTRALEKARLMARFHRLINLKLEQLEQDMSRKDERTPAEKERETRALGSLIRTYEKVAGVEREGNDEATRNGPERQAETEALRREVAERIVRLRREQPDDGK